MGELTATVLAAEEGGGGTSNFLVPNGTFFAVLLIFLIVLGVICEMGCATGQQGSGRARGDAGQDCCGQPQVGRAGRSRAGGLRQGDGRARAEASSIRDEARAAGRKVVDEKRAEASGEVAETVQSANAQLSEQTRGHARRELESSVDGLSATLASRILGVDVENSGGRQLDVDIHRPADRLRCHHLHRVKWVVPPVRTMMHNQQEAMRAALAESSRGGEEARRRGRDARQGARGCQGRKPPR